MWKYLKEIKCLKSLQKAKVYLEPKRASDDAFFKNKINGLLFWQYKLHHRCLTGLYMVSENIKIFKGKLNWSKLSRLLQRIV